MDGRRTAREIGRILVRVAGALIVFEVLYIFAANLALRASLPLARGPVTVVARDPWTFLPTLVQASAVEIRGPGWAATLERAHLRLDPASLLRGQILATEVRGEARHVRVGELVWEGEGELSAARLAAHGNRLEIVDFALLPRSGELRAGILPSAREVRGALRGDLVMEQGRALSGSALRAELAAQDLQVPAPCWRGRAAPWAVLEGRAAEIDLDIAPGPAGLWEGALRGDVVDAAWSCGTFSARGDLELDLRLSELRPGARIARIATGELRAAHLALTTATGAWSDLGAEIELREACVDIGSTPELVADIDLRLSDVAPLAMSLEHRGALPEGAAAVLVGGDLSATARVDVRRGALELELPRAEGRGFAIRGALERGPAGTAGAFLLDQGFLSAGIAIQGGGAELTPFVGKPWLDDQLAGLDLGAERR